MEIAADGFDWDEGNREKCRKHGLAPSDIEAFLKGDIRVAPDPAHSQQEDRFIAVGRIANGRPSICGVHVSAEGQAAADPADQCALHAQKGG